MMVVGEYSTMFAKNSFVVESGVSPLVVGFERLATDSADRSLSSDILCPDHVQYHGLRY